MKGHDASAFLFYPSTVPSVVLFFGFFSLVWFSFSLGLPWPEERGKNYQPEEIFPVVLHTLKCTAIVKWSLGAKMGEIRETSMILI